MKVLGFKTIQIASIVLPGDFHHRQKQDHVKEKAKSISEIGLLHEPIVRKTDMRLLAGEDRIAAASLLGETCLVKLVECSDAEAEEVRDHENVYRRHDVTEQRATLARLVERKARQIAIQTAPMCANPIRPPGRPKGPERLAREEVARALGTSERAVEAALEKQRGAAMLDGTPRIDKLKPTATIKTLGIELGQEWLDEVGRIQNALTACMHRLKAAQGDLTDIKHMGPEGTPVYPEIRLNRLYELIHAAAYEVRAAIPASLCPFCKGMPGLQEQCAACVTLGFVTASQLDQVPPELLEEGERARVLHAGRMWLVSELSPEPATMAGAPPPATAIDATPLNLTEDVTGAPPEPVHFQEPQPEPQPVEETWELE